MTQTAQLPRNEMLRLEKLKQLVVLDTPPEPLFDEIVKLASEICGTSISLVSLIDERRQWFKANYALDAMTEVPREFALCSHAILEDKVLNITDASKDPRFKNNPLVTHDPNIRFYAGAPITIAEGIRVGTICVIDRTPKQLTPQQSELLEGLASIVSKALIVRKSWVEESIHKSSVLEAIVEDSNDAIIGETVEGVIFSWNAAAERVFGYTSQEINGRHVSVLFPKETDENQELVFINKIKNNKKIKLFETERITKNGKRIQVSISLSAIKNAVGEIIGISKIVRDITEQKKLQNKIAEACERLNVTMDSIGNAVITTDIAGLIQYLNPVAEALTGWSNDEAVGKPLIDVFKIVNETTRRPCINPVELCLKEDRIVGLANHTVLINRHGKEYGIEDSASPIKDKHGNTIGIVMVFHDVTRQRKMANEISFRATHDGLTGLLNRGEFEQRMKKFINNHREPDSLNALMFIDLDQFKVINDTCGHAAGDAVLKEVSNIMRHFVRQTDVVARIGGDEFAIILAKCGADKALEIANAICKAVEQYRFYSNEQRFQIGASIGLVMIDKHWTSLNELIQAADNACLEAKRTGRNRVHLHIDDDLSLANHKDSVQWASRITQAIEDDGFVLFAQRIMPLDEEGLEHAEILVRLKSDQGDLIPPGAFMPAAERFHLISRVDRWVLRNTFDWLHRNQAFLNHVESLSINLSGQSLVDLTFHEFANQIANDIKIDYTKICFEITETSAVTNILDAKKFIDRMRQYGIQFSLDDFGSGASSFGYLRNFPVSYLKIDGQFIKDLLENEIGQATVKCITEVAKITHTKTIAEWVDNDDVEALLKKMGVNFTQGYLKHKPAPIEYLLNKECLYSH